MLVRYECPRCDWKGNNLKHGLGPSGLTIVYFCPQCGLIKHKLNKVVESEIKYVNKSGS